MPSLWWEGSCIMYMSSSAKIKTIVFVTILTERTALLCTRRLTSPLKWFVKASHFTFAYVISAESYCYQNHFSFFELKHEIWWFDIISTGKKWSKSLGFARPFGFLCSKYVLYVLMFKRLALKSSTSKHSSHIIYCNILWLTLWCRVLQPIPLKTHNCKVTLKKVDKLSLKTDVTWPLSIIVYSCFYTSGY